MALHAGIRNIRNRAKARPASAAGNITKMLQEDGFFRYLYRKQLAVKHRLYATRHRVRRSRRAARGLVPASSRRDGNLLVTGKRFGDRVCQSGLNGYGIGSFFRWIISSSIST